MRKKQNDNMKKTESKASVLIAEIEGGLHDAKLIQLYQDHDPVQVHRARCVKALTDFIARFGDKPVEVYSSPGRSEICGNHCDHQNGCVIAACVDADILAVISRRDDALIHLCSEGYEPVELDLTETRMIPEEAGTMAAAGAT